jgi:hypothetical protein
MYIIILIIAFHVLIYLAPVPFFFRLWIKEKVRGRILVGGIIPITFPKEKKEKPEKKKKKKKPKKTRREFDAHRFFELVLEERFRQKTTGALKRYVKRIFRTFSIKITKGNLTYGSGDPAKTGLMAGKYYAFIHTASFLDIGRRFTFQPEFTRKCIEGEIRARVLIYPGRLFFFSILLIIEWPILKTLSLFKKVKVQEA